MGQIDIQAEARFRKHVHPLQSTTKRILSILKCGASLEITLVGKGRMDKNVLAFRWAPGFPKPDIGGEYLGEIFLNPDYITQHGESITYMVIHGILHLLGYDHMTTHDR